jgi:hypothetical protein
LIHTSVGLAGLVPAGVVLVVVVATVVVVVDFGCDVDGVCGT